MMEDSLVSEALLKEGLVTDQDARNLLLKLFLSKTTETFPLLPFRSLLEWTTV
jgi:hypothetical protein